MNVWRNKNRSLVVIVAVTLGIISGVLLVGIMNGWVEQRLHDAIYNEVSHIQIHNTEYLKNEEILLTVNDTTEMARAIETLPGLSGWVKRTRMVAMANTPWANTGVIIYGIDPVKEKQVTEIYKKIVPGGGEYLDKFLALILSSHAVLPAIEPLDRTASGSPVFESDQYQDLQE